MATDQNDALLRQLLDVASEIRDRLPSKEEEPAPAPAAQAGPQAVELREPEQPKPPTKKAAPARRTGRRS